MSDNKKRLYRNPSKGKIAGVCAGIAEYYDVEVWLVRVLVLSGLLLSAFSVVLLAYFVAACLLNKKPQAAEEAETSHRTLKTKVWRTGASPAEALADADGQFQQLEQRLRQVEQQVTSSAFDLKRKINQLK